MPDLTVACVQVENYLGRGQEYVDKLLGMVARNFSRPHRFECITESDKPSWFAKCDLFEPGRFCGRVLYLDLDTVICGSLDELAAIKGTVHLTDWGWAKNMYGNAIMVWDAGEHEEVWTRYTPDVPKRFRGDADWMFELGGWPALPKGMNVSYRYHAKAGPPAGAVTVSMHGKPKPHEILTGWVPKLWVA
ncbi:MAG: hypothetical protein ACTS6J_01965 [Burkholderiales bacterium]